MASNAAISVHLRYVLCTYVLYFDEAVAFAPLRPIRESKRPLFSTPQGLSSITVFPLPLQLITLVRVLKPQLSSYLHAAIGIDSRNA